MANPSWCFDVITMYFIPASCAICTHSSALNFTGLNCLASCSYSETGILARFIIHSPRPAIFSPFHSPAGTAYRPQWMKRPNLASRNHFILASCEGGAGSGFGRFCAFVARTHTVVSDKIRLFMAVQPILLPDEAGVQTEIVRQQERRAVAQRPAVGSLVEAPRIDIPVLDVALVDRQHLAVRAMPGSRTMSLARVRRQPHDVLAMAVPVTPRDAVHRKAAQRVERVGQPVALRREVDAIEGVGVLLALRGRGV